MISFFVSSCGLACDVWRAQATTTVTMMNLSQVRALYNCTVHGMIKKKEKVHAGYRGQPLFYLLFSDGTVDEIYVMDTMSSVCLLFACEYMFDIG